jgi:predicted NBD/HSP70 family sugar kinase
VSGGAVNGPRPGGPSGVALPGDVLALLRAAGPLTRNDVMARTGLARSTVNQRLDALLRAQLVVQAGGETTARGRPPSQFAFNRNRGVLLVADVGATGLRAALTDLAGTVRLERTRRIDVAEGPVAVLGALTGFFDEMLAEAGHPPGDVHGIGLDVPGPVDFASGRVVSPPIMSGWDGYDIPGWFRPRFGCPVLVENDVNAMAFGEQRTVHPDVDSLLVLKVGTGVGAGIVWRGEVFRGADGAAGDIGHIQVAVPGEAPPLCRCGNSGCVEARAGGWAMVRDLRAAGRDVASVDDAVALVLRGDTTAVGLARRAGRVLGSAVADAVSLLNPRAVVLTGQLAAAEEQLMAGVREMVYSRSLPLATSRIHITRSALGERGGVVGTSLLLADLVFAPQRIDRDLA